MKRLVSFILFAAVLLNLCACAGKPTEQSNSGISENEDAQETTAAMHNPLADKTYDSLVIDDCNSTEFNNLFGSLREEYAGYIIAFSDYLVLHENEIENEGKGMSDFADYEDSFDAYYEFLNKVMYCEDEVPNAYQLSWSDFVTTLWNNKENLDNLYYLNGQELIEAS